MTDPVFLPEIPRGCCADGARYTSAWATAWYERDQREAMRAQQVWTDHQQYAHRAIGRPQAECVDCLEWLAILGQDPMDDVPLDTITGREASAHFLSHWILDPLRAAAAAGRAADAADPSAGDTPDVSALYRERAHLVAYLASRSTGDAVMTAAPDVPGWALVFVETNQGQLSWHIHPDDVPLFQGAVKWVDEWSWDGHTTEEKYSRLRAVTLNGPGYDVEDLSSRLAAAQRTGEKETSQ